MRLTVVLLVALMHTVVAETAPNDTSALLFSLANPTAQLGFDDDAAGVTLPDFEKIMAELTDAQQDEIVQKTLEDIARFYNDGNQQGGSR